MSSSGSALATRGLSKSFESSTDHVVHTIEDLTFDVAPGSFVAVVGPSGGGKTTLLKIIAGLIPPSGGEVFMHGERVEGPISDFGMVFQNPVLLPWRTALDNVMLPIEILGLDRARYEAKARELFDLMGLQGFENRRPRELSGGMQQRVSLCRALIHDPGILLMDEPFAALDELTRQSLNDYLLTLWEASKKTVIFVTHSVAEAVYLADRVLILTSRPARLVDIVDVGLARPRHPDLRYEAAFAAKVREVQEKLREAS